MSTKDPVPSFSASTPTAIPWEQLSDRGQAILRRVAIPLAAGYSTAEIGKGLKMSKRSVDGLLDELRAEIEGR